MRTLNRWLLVAAGCLVSCGGKNVGPYLSLVVAQPERNNTCQGEGALNTLTGLARTRLTVRVRQPGSTTPQICDLLLEAGAKAPPPLRFPTPPAGSTVDFFAEAFRAGPSGYERIASGALFGQSLTPNQAYNPDAPRPLTLVPTQSFRCLPRLKLRRTRAFHSATVLPNGQILFLGGLANSTSDNSIAGADFYIVGSAEVYDPTTEAFVTLTGGDALTPRAFHQAAVLPPPASNPNLIEIVLVGGVSYASPSGTPPAAFTTNTTFAGNLRLTPVANLIAVPATEILTYDPAARTLTRRAAAGLEQIQPAIFQGGAPLSGRRLALAGGFTSLAANVSASVANDTAALITTASTGSSLGSDSRVGVRVGPGLVPIDDNSVLLVGGNDPSTNPVAVVDYASPAYGSPTVLSGGLPPLWFPTVTPFVNPADTQIHALVSGGFLRDGNGAYSPSTLFPQRLDYDPASGYSVTQVAPLGDLSLELTCPPTDPGHLRPVAWNAATRLLDGRILLSGGTARFGGADCGSGDCEENDATPTCAVHQALLYDGATNRIQALSPLVNGAREGLQIARWGHSQTLLPDGTVLVAGGFTRSGQCQNSGGACGSNADCITPDTCVSRNTTGTVDLELFNPARSGVSVSAGSDQDDPVRADLTGQGLGRELGEQAHTSTSTAPALPCSVLER
ncbi:MAG TPA: hypothetical protein VH877_27640 [Polyangia bacterium]|jgi:hypothetical protein|nr:hypothetical protein [Polyangia bacterium]